MMRFRFTRQLGLCISLWSVSLSGVSGQQPDDQVRGEEVTALRESVKNLSEQLADLTMYLRTVLPPSPVVEIEPVDVSIDKVPMQGKPTARLVFIEFSDFECSFCAQYAQTAYRQILSEFVETGQIQYVSRNLPLAQLHPQALKAAEAAECAGRQGQFWQMHERLFANQKMFNLNTFALQARDLGLKESEFEDCLSGGLTASRIQEDLAEAQRLGITGTPTFLVGYRATDKSVRATHRIIGAQPFHVFQMILRFLLSKEPR
jgi:protein-disulfide isomerase